MRGSILAAILSLSPCLALADDDPAKAEREKLEGTWLHVKGYRASGELVPAPDFRVRFSGETMTNIPSPTSSVTFRVSLDPSRSPKAIFWHNPREGVPPRRGIYRVEGDTLEISWAAGPRNEWPTALGPCPKDSKVKWTYGVMRRETGSAVLPPEEAARAAERGIEARRTLAVGTPAPEIEGADLEGKTRKLSDYRGKVVALNFWGAWCGPCLTAIRRERELFERLKGQPFAPLGVDCNDEVPVALGVARREGMDWPSWHDGIEPDGPIAVKYHISGFPSLFVIDAKGVIRAVNPSGDELDRLVNSLLDEIETPRQ